MRDLKRHKCVCSVAVCPSPKDSHIIYHRFPKDPDLVTQWMRLSSRTYPFNHVKATICSTHFVPDDYERDLQNELLGIPVRKRLKKNAVPSLKLLPQDFKADANRLSKLKKLHVMIDPDLQEKLEEEVKQRQPRNRRPRGLFSTYVCPICHEVFDTTSSLSRHHAEGHPLKKKLPRILRRKQNSESLDQSSSCFEDEMELPLEVVIKEESIDLEEDEDISAYEGESGEFEFVQVKEETPEEDDFIPDILSEDNLSLVTVTDGDTGVSHPSTLKGTKRKNKSRF